MALPSLKKWLADGTTTAQKVLIIIIGTNTIIEMVVGRWLNYGTKVVGRWRNHGKGAL